MSLLKTVFHVHTNYSDDANSSPERLLEDARRAGVGCIAVTDHDTIEGAKRVAALAGRDLKVVVGEEISTSDGHLIGLFLHEPIDPGYTARQTANLIHQQGGLVVAPHPFNRLFGCSLRDNIYDVIDVIDVVEVCNGQNLLQGPNHRADAFARRHSLPRIAGLDMHHRGHLDACYQLMPRFDGPIDFIPALEQAELRRGRHSLSYFVRAAHVTARSKLHLAPPRGYGVNCKRHRPMFAPRSAVAE